MRARLDRHAKYRELLSARLDRQLTRTENRMLVAHLKSCPDCQQVERDYRDQSVLLRSLPTPPPPRDMWARTSTALDREVARRTYDYPRIRRSVLAPERPRSTGPSAIATVVAAVGVVTALVVMQLTPTLRPSPANDSDANSAGLPKPTPFAVAPQALALVSTGEGDLTVYQTQVSEVCPTTAPDCFDDKVFSHNSFKLSNMRPQNVAMNPEGDRIAVVGHNTTADVFAVVLLLNDQPSREPDTNPQQPAASPTATARASASHAASSATPAVDASPTIKPTDGVTPPDGSQEPEPTADATPDSPAVNATDEPPATDAVQPPDQTPAAAPSSPPASAVPGLTVLSILDDVHSAGAPPAWSRDSSLLAFSAMPADGSHGPDVYVWQPGDQKARPITSDHSSFFASWSGRRVVASRVMDADPTGTGDVATVVIDPTTLEERVVSGPQMWLPIVDPQRTHAVAWDGDLDFSTGLPEAQSGALYMFDWSAVDPYRASTEPSGDIRPVALDPSRNPDNNPVLDWHVRWSTDGRVLGVWETDAPHASWGTLELMAFDPETGKLRLDDPLLPPQTSKRGFTLGTDRVAWVGSTNNSADGELRIRTWGTDGVGDLRIESLDLQEIVPTF